jgi:tetratricopeptide (TPR) repeat protein
MMGSSNANPRRFAVALSFPGEYRDFISKVADSLAHKLGKERILYDKYHEAEFARPNLDVHLPNLYSTESELIAIFLCNEYKKKRWCNLEWRSIRQLIATADEDRIMFLSFDNVGAIPEIGIYDGDGYVSIGARSPDQIADLILQRCGPPRKDVIAAPNLQFDISRIIKYAPAELIGREVELKILSDAWDKTVRKEKGRPHVLTFVALGGEGKTSLVAKWAAELARDDWPGCDAAFAWSFYSQGTREQLAASSDLFLKEALTFFGGDEDKDFAASPAGAFEKGQRLARIVGERRSLLILDGLEPLQYAPTSPTPGQLRDQGITALLKGLGQNSRGLCVVTTRYSLPDLRAFWQTTAPEVALLRLSRKAGVHLLKTLGVKGSERRTLMLKEGEENSEKVNEFEKLVEDAKRHALTLTLLGSYLSDAHGGDIRKRSLVKLEEADDEVEVIPDHPHHAFHVMDAYVEWFERGGENETENEKGLRALALLRLLGLFDRPATADCLNALWNDEAIAGLTEPLIGLTEAQRNTALKRLDNANLLTVNRDASGALISLDAHPHLREYFARELRTQQPDAWRAAHRRLYEYLCTTTENKDEPTLEDLQPLYQAVAHGCQAGLQQKACDNVYRDQIMKGGEAYVIHKLGAFGCDVGAIACFFEQPWNRISSALSEPAQAWLLGEAAFRLRALGRLTEALEPMRAGLKDFVMQENWTSAAAGASTLSELKLTLGQVAGAVKDAEQSVIYADRSSSSFHPYSKRCTLGEALHQAGRRTEALENFREAEQMQREDDPDASLLYSARGFKYCDLLLAGPERAAWQTMVRGAGVPPMDSLIEHVKNAGVTCRAVSERVAQTIKVAGVNKWVLDIALDHLTMGRAALYDAILSGSSLVTCRSFLADAMSGLRRSENIVHIPSGLLTRAWLNFLRSERTGQESAQEDIDEALEIAERGPMRLHMADIHLYRARLFHAMKPYPWDKFPDGSKGRGPKDDLADARKLIELCGYWRRKEELEDAEEAAKSWA